MKVERRAIRESLVAALVAGAGGAVAGAAVAGAGTHFDGWLVGWTSQRL